MAPLCKYLARGRIGETLVQTSPDRTYLPGLLHQRKLFTYDLSIQAESGWTKRLAFGGKGMINARIGNRDFSSTGAEFSASIPNGTLLPVTLFAALNFGNNTF